MNRKIIFFDIDGTIFSGEIGYITEKVKKAIRDVKQKGHLCFIASGRPYAFIADNVKDIGFDGYVLANGAGIKYHNQDLKTRFLKYEDVKELVDNLNKKNIEYILSSTDYSYIHRKQKCLLNFFKNVNIDFKNFMYDFDEDEILHRVVKIEVWVKNIDELEYAKSLYGKFAYELHPDNHSMEVYSKDVSKATAIQDVLHELEIPLEDSYCFGDGPNDVEMFETVAHPIAMGNALDVIKEKAEDICLSVLEDGVAHKLEELFL